MLKTVQTGVHPVKLNEGRQLLFAVSIVIVFKVLVSSSEPKAIGPISTKLTQSITG